MLSTTKPIAQQDEATSALALLEQGDEAANDSVGRTGADDHSLHSTEELDEPKGDRNLSMSERRLSKTSENLFECSLVEPSESLEAASDSDIEEGQSKTSRRRGVKQQQEQHRAEHREKKRMLRRRRLIRETEDAQDEEPKKVNPFNALPCFEYLELSEDVQVELPSELVGFESMDLSEAEPQNASPLLSIDGFAAEILLDSPAVFEDQDVVDAAARMLKLIEDLPVGGLDLEAMPLPPEFDADMVSPDIRSELASTLMHGASSEETSLQPSPTHEANPRNANRFSTPIPIDSLVGPISATAASEFSRVQVQSSVLPNAMRDNFLCHYATCPVTEMHCEGPYHYKGRLGDQDHAYFQGSNPPPSVWEAYDRVVRGISSSEEDEMVTGFWAWHVPPFCYIPDGPDDVFCSRPDAQEDVMVGDQDMGDA